MKKQEISKLDQIEMAIQLIKDKHKGQFDKGGNPYELHPLSIALSEDIDTIEQKIVCLLHDIIEDTDVKREDLVEMGFCEEIVQAVEIVTKKEKEDYFSFIKRIKSSKNNLAISCKIADLIHNLDISRIPNPTQKDYDRQEKYLKALDILKTNNEINKISHESCFSLLSRLENNSIDLILIDPPYEISRDTNFQSGAEKGTDVDRFRVSMDFGEWDKDFNGLDIVIKECYRVLKKGGTIICFYDLWKITTLKEHFDNAKFKQTRFIEWIKNNPVPINSKINYLTNSREIALTGVKGGKPTFNSQYDKGIYEYPICHEKGRFHPNQKPLPLIEDLILKHSNEGDIVADFFSGSATTAAACLNKKRHFIGCETDPVFYSKSIERINNIIKK